MPRNSGDSDLYLPLFAGTELARRSGNLTRFPPGNLLGNLPVNGLRVRRRTSEASTTLPCEFPPGTELFNALWYSDFGDVAAGGLDRSNYLWLPINGTVEHDGNRIVSSPGVPSNNVHGSATAQFQHKFAALYGANPIYVGNCARLRQTVEIRYYRDRGQGEHYRLVWLDRPIIPGPVVVNDDEPLLYNPGMQMGIMASQGGPASNLYWFDVGKPQVVDDYFWSQDYPELAPGTGTSVLIKMEQESVPGVGVTARFYKDGVLQGGFTNPKHWIEPRQFLWPNLTLDSYYASTTREPAELYAGWKLETF